MLLPVNSESKYDDDPGDVETARKCNTKPDQPSQPTQSAKQMEIHQEECQLDNEDHRTVDGDADDGLQKPLIRVVANLGIPEMLSRARFSLCSHRNADVCYDSHLSARSVTEHKPSQSENIPGRPHKHL
ncbi:MAG: hypothetical protein Q9220_000450 [cf. Caloplaca sp. 1 TL-2023]